MAVGKDFPHLLGCAYKLIVFLCGPQLPRTGISALLGQFEHSHELSCSFLGPCISLALIVGVVQALGRPLWRVEDR
jgi:hypothetical protein